MHKKKTEICHKKKEMCYVCFGLVTVATFEIDICLNKRQCHSVILFSVLHIYTENGYARMKITDL